MKHFYVVYIQLTNVYTAIRPSFVLNWDEHEKKVS